MSNSKFYEVAYEEAEILHTGDMALTEEIYQNISDSDVCNKLADEYWSGGKSNKPRIEILLPKATVSKIVSKSEFDKWKAKVERIT